MKYKVGDRVRIKSLDWYNENKDILGNIDCGDALMTFEKERFCGKIVTISSISDIIDVYRIEEDNGLWNWTDEMIECKVEESKPNIIEEAKTYWDGIKDAWICPEGYIFKDENGNVINATKIVLEKKKKEYPKTFLECCDVLNIGNLIERGVKGYKAELFDTLQKLCICRDAYWKLYGEEMGLGKPWKPDCNSGYFIPAIIYRSGSIQKVEVQYRNAIFSFPTTEMRNAFKENFDSDIEICKEFL